MKSLALVLIVGCVLLAGCSGETGPTSTPIPEATGYVVDDANILSPAAEQSIEAELSDYEQRTSNEIAVLIVGSTEYEMIDTYAVQVFEKWGIGKEDRDNGVLLLLAIDDRAARIEVGYGAEGDLVDSEADQILRNVVFPNLRAGNPEQAVQDGQRAIRSQLGDPNVGEVPLAAAPVPSPQGSDEPGWLPFVIFGGFILLPILFGGRRRRRGGFGGGPFIITSGGGFGGGGFGGGGGGGFGGFGGGMSGGGGASGSW